MYHAFIIKIAPYNSFVVLQKFSLTRQGLLHISIDTHRMNVNHLCQSNVKWFMIAHQLEFRGIIKDNQQQVMVRQPNHFKIITI